MIMRVGDNAPDFELPNQDGEMSKLSDFKGKKVALYFYVKDDTPGCTKQSCNLRDNLNILKKKGIVILGISPGDIGSHKKFEKKYKLNFPLLADVGAKVAKRYGVYGGKSFMGRFFMGVKRTTFLINGKGKIFKIIYKIDVGNHAEQILEGFRYC